jgi:cell division transport system permease protein
MIAAGLLPLSWQFRLDVPLRRDASSRFLPWIIALLLYLVAIGGIGIIWLSDALNQWNASLESALTLQVPADTTQPRIDMALGALRQTKGVISAQLLQPDQTAKLLQPWLGANVPIASLPLPHLIDIRIDPHAQIDFATLRGQLDTIIPNAQLDDNHTGLASIRDFAMRVEGVIAAGVAVVAAFIVAIIIFTARIGLAIHRPVIELLHLLGARDAYIARQFQTHALSLGLRGGFIGAAAAALTVGIVGPAGRMLVLPVPITPYGILDWRMWLLLVAAWLAAGIVAMITARITVLRQLARMP